MYKILNQNASGLILQRRHCNLKLINNRTFSKREHPLAVPYKRSRTGTWRAPRGFWVALTPPRANHTEITDAIPGLRPLHPRGPEGLPKLKDRSANLLSHGQAMMPRGVPCLIWGLAGSHLQPISLTPTAGR